MKTICLCIFLSLVCFSLKGQELFYSEILKGGITGNGGYAGAGAGTINFPIQIPPGSIIEKAFLVAARDSLADDITVKLNGINYTFNNNSIVTNGFVSLNNPSYPLYRPSSSIHVINITDDINASINSYSLTIPPQWPPFKGLYSLIYLIVIFKNSSIPFTCVNLFLNKMNVSPIMNYHLFPINPINNGKPVGLFVNTTDFCDTIVDGSYVQVNTDTIGLLGGDDLNSHWWTCVGPWANFSYYNQTIIGLDDDTPDAFMHGTDATANIQNYVSNNDMVLDLYFKYQSNMYPLTNPIRSVILAYTTPCDTFSVKLLTEDTTVCRGNTVQLGVSGGNTALSKPAYEWLPQKDLSCYDCANPVFSGDSSQVYTVRIWNTDSCSKVLPVRVKVLPPPAFGQITTQNTLCGAQSGSIAVALPAQDSLFFNNNFAGLTPLTLSNLGAGTDTLYLKDSLGCVSQDTLVTLKSSNNTQALFSVNPQTGAAPLSVTTDNQSTNATDYVWYFLNDSTTSFAPNMTFDTSGTYTVTLLAYQNSIACADTFSLSVTVYDSLQLIVPNIITANGDGTNDVFSIQVNAPCKGSVSILNRWGNVVFTKDFATQGKEKISLWDGTSQGQKVDDGVYFYLFRITDAKGAENKLEGFVSVVR